MDYKVSVIMPSLNVEPYIRECMDSVLGQSLEEIEVICVDAGSTDGTWEILTSYAKQDERVVLLRSDVKSYGKQANMGISSAKGKYIAIVETDDYVDKEMYRYLYEVAEEHSLECVKADYDAFVTDSNGNRLFTRTRVFGGNKANYNKICSPELISQLYRLDTSVWKGIYDRNFLIENNVNFNETSGAAFQDIGFQHKLFGKIKRIMYVDKSFYRYCMDREGSSSNCPKGLQYAWQEYRCLSEQDNKHLFAGRMADVFLCEYDKVLKYLNFQYDKAIFEEYYVWFKTQIEELIEKGVLTSKDFENKRWRQLQLLLYSPQGYADYMYIENRINKAEERDMIKVIGQRHVVIFGSGLYGMAAYVFLKQHEVQIDAFCDNNSAMWGEKRGMIEIYPPEKSFLQFSEDVYVVATKYHSDEIRGQIKRAGISDKQIIFFQNV